MFGGSETLVDLECMTLLQSLAEATTEGCRRPARLRHRKFRNTGYGHRFGGRIGKTDREFP